MILIISIISTEGIYGRWWCLILINTSKYNSFNFTWGLKGFGVLRNRVKSRVVILPERRDRIEEKVDPRELSGRGLLGIVGGESVRYRAGPVIGLDGGRQQRKCHQFACTLHSTRCLPACLIYLVRHQPTLLFRR